MALHVGQYGDVFGTLHSDANKTSYFNGLRTSVKGVLRALVGDPLALHGGPYGDVHRTSSARIFAEWDVAGYGKGRKRVNENQEFKVKFYSEIYTSIFGNE